VKPENTEKQLGNFVTTLLNIVFHPPRNAPATHNIRRTNGKAALLKPLIS
jgi:hypothetical protein